MEIRDYPDARLRVTAQQRDHAAAILREAVVDGRLDVEELNSRLPGALNAHSREDLYRVLDDLVPAAELPKVVAEGVPLGEGPGMTWENPLLIKADWKGDERIGVWDLPPFIELLGTGWGSIKLNCVLARPLAKVIDVVISGNPSVLIVVPEGWGVDVQQLNGSGQSGGISSLVPTRPVGDKPRLILRGSTTMQVKVRTPGYWDRRALAKHQRELEQGGGPKAITQG
ncbi:MAG: DUF1707 domain-containing protein [Propionibacteriaceae bacterium]|nr:DUF1707 domain-containing protein [Propionibacteriaceae bacterium]